MRHFFTRTLKSVFIASIVVTATSHAATAQDDSSDAPRNWQETLNVMNGHSAAGSAAVTMRRSIAENRSIDIQDKTSTAYENAENALDRASIRHGVNAATLDAGYARDKDIATLQEQLDNATDDTDLTIVAARAQLANGKMLNEMIKLQSANGMFEGQRDAAQEELDRSDTASYEALGKPND